MIIIMIISKVYSFIHSNFNCCSTQCLSIKSQKLLFIFHETTENRLQVSSIFSKILGLIFVLYTYKYVYITEIKYISPTFPFWISIAPLMTTISLKCFGHGSRYKDIGKPKLRPVHDGLPVNTSCSFFPTEHPFLWKTYSSSTYFPRCLLFKRHIKKQKSVGSQSTHVRVAQWLANCARKPEVPCSSPTVPNVQR